MAHKAQQDFSSFIPGHVLLCMKLLSQNGYESYLVGGAVRDLLLCSIPADFDLATNASPEKILEIFADYKTIPTGIVHGTVTVLLFGRTVEITSYRKDGSYSDVRRPDEVLFGCSLEQDVQRRDFTINALAMDASGRVLDYVGGQEDLSNRLIRSVGDPDIRMQEDSLRILRALRFSAALGFSIEEKTRRSMFRNKDLLKRVSSERVWTELSGILCGINTELICRHYISVLGVVIPELLPMKGFDQHTSHHLYDVWEHTVRVIAHTPPQKVLRLAALFHDIGKPVAFCMDDSGIGHFPGHQKISTEIAHKVLLRLTADTRTREQVETLVLWHDTPIEPAEKIIRRRLHQLGENALRDLLLLKRADMLAQSQKSLCRIEELMHVQELLETVLAENACFSLKDLQINGKDLIEMGASPGKELGRVLQTALQKVIDGDLPNSRDTLLAFAREMLGLGR